MKNFTDNFSKQSDIYAQYRPHYPKELFEYLAGLTDQHETAWDCGTGNGQAAIGLTPYFKTILATDPSENQIKHAYPHARVNYRVERAEIFQHESNSIDLITVANALHWFDHETFYPLVDRVLKPNGVFAAWAYEVPLVSVEIDKVTRHFHDVIVDEFWAQPNRLVENEYRDLIFPYPFIDTPMFYSHREFDLKDFVAYFNTWSATQKFIAARGYNPTVRLEEDLLPFWGDSTLKRRVSWKLILKAGRKINS
jgi:ubiquinone/menaquinone biosynthesis C-methylase UbiE